MPAEPHRGTAEWRPVVFALLRIVGATVAILVVYFEIPQERSETAPEALAVVAVGLTVFGVIFWHQLRRIRSARYPMLRAAEAIVLVATLFIVLMSSIATALSNADASNYSEPLSRVDALYFTVTTLATVGFGDITPTTPTTRAVTTLQIVLGVTLLGAGLRSLATVGQRARDSGDTAGP